MKTTITEKEGIITIAVSGELDTDTTLTFRSEVEPVTLRKGVNVELDFSELEYISSKALRVLISLQQQVKAGGGSFGVVNVQPAVKEVFDMTGLSASLIKD
ncbi:MAG: STAS domain-containing protein [Bacteroidales bacterium]|nr:STAS domain-containing protein [Bacteroidales bacterium]